jgi:hypothetical protein
MIFCGDTVVVANKDTGNITIPDTIMASASARLNVVVRDAYSGAAVRGARVELLSVGDTLSTGESATGTVTFEEVAIGTHSVLITADGYAGYVARAVINFSNIGGRGANVNTPELYVARDTTINVSLYKRDAKLTGQIFYDDRSGLRREASNVRVRVELTDPNFLERFFEVLTDDNGKYTFDSLPAVGGSAYNIWALQFIADDGIVYGVTNITPDPGISLKSNDIIHAGVGRYLVAATQFTLELLSYPTSGIDNNDPVVFLFSDTIDATKIASNTVKVTTATPFDVAWRDNKLTITPLGTWRSNIIVEFQTLLYSKTTGDQLDLRQNPPYLITVLDVPDFTNVHVKNVRVMRPDSVIRSSTQVRLGWDPLVSADSFVVFAKKRGDLANPDYQRVGVATMTSAHVFFNNNGTIIENDTYTYIVQAYNGRSRSRLEGADTVNVSSIVTTEWVSKVPNDSTLVFYSSNPQDINQWFIQQNLSMARTDSVITNGFYSFTEDMDTTKMTLHFSAFTIEGRQIFMRYTWSNPRALNVRLVIGPGAAVSSYGERTVNWSIRNLESLSGKKFLVGYEFADGRLVLHDYMNFRMPIFAYP